MRVMLIAALLTLSGQSLAQINEFNSQFMLPGPTSTQMEFGPNFYYVSRNNFFDSGLPIANQTNLTWFGFDSDGEVIDEIVLTAKRWVPIDTGGAGPNAVMQVYLMLEFGDPWQERCTFYSDGGHCLTTERTIDTDNWPLAGNCQTVSGTMGPITWAEATELNLDYQQTRAILSGTGAGLATIGAHLLTAGQSAWLQWAALIGVPLGTLVGTYPDAGDFPFQGGDIITYTLDACNDGDGSIDVDMSVDIRR